MHIENILSDEQKAERSTFLLARVGLEDRMDHLPSELSGISTCLTTKVVKCKELQ